MSCLYPRRTNVMLDLGHWIDSTEEEGYDRTVDEKPEANGSVEKDAK